MNGYSLGHFIVQMRILHKRNVNSFKVLKHLNAIQSLVFEKMGIISDCTNFILIQLLTLELKLFYKMWLGPEYRLFHKVLQKFCIKLL